MKKIYLLAFIIWATTCAAMGQACITFSPTSISGQEFNLCGGKTVSYTCTPVDGATGYSWEVPEGFTIASGQGTSTVTVKTAAVFQTVQIKVRAIFPCGNSIPTTKELEGRIPAGTIITGPREVVRGSTNAYSVPSTPGLKYSWVADGSNVVGGWNTNSVTIKVGAFVKRGQVLSTINNGCGGQVSSLYFSVIEAENCPSLEATYQITNPDRCNGSSNGAVTLTVNGGNPPYTYKWYGPNGFTSTSQNVSGLVKGNYAVIIKDSKGCTTTLEYIYLGDLYPFSKPPYPISGPTSNLCGVKTVSYTATETPGATAYNWTIPNGFTLVSGQGTKTITLKTPPKFDLAFLKVSATIACGTLDPISIDLLGTPPDLQNQISGPDQVVAGSTNTYSLPAVPGLSYSWVADGGNVVGGWGSNSVSIKAGTINHYVRATVKNACSTAPLLTKFVGIRTGESCTLPSVFGSVTHPERCLGSKTGAIRLVIRDGVGPFTFQWYGPNGFFRTTQNISAIEDGVYKVIVYAPGGCYTELGFKVGPPTEDKDRDFPGPIRGQFENLCGIKTINYTCTLMPDATSYEWVVPAGFTLVSGQGTNSITVQTPATFTTAELKVRAMIACGYTDYRNLALSSTIRNTSETLYVPEELFAGQTTECYWGPLSDSWDYSGFSYSWVADGGNVVGGWGSNRVSVKAGRISGYVRLTMKNKCGTAPLGLKYFKVLNADIPYGSSSVLDALDVTDAPAAAARATSFGIYPNPAENVATVEFSSEENNERYELRVVDFYGKVLQSKNGVAIHGTNIVKLDLGNYAKGVYMVNLLTKKKARIIKLLKK